MKKMLQSQPGEAGSWEVERVLGRVGKGDGVGGGKVVTNLSIRS